MKKYQKRVRLKDFPYQGCYRYFITIVTDRKKNVFVEHKIVEQILKKLKDSITTCHFNLLAYCFMPDHLHILVEGKDQERVS